MPVSLEWSVDILRNNRKLICNNTSTCLLTINMVLNRIYYVWLVLVNSCANFVMSLSRTNLPKNLREALDDTLLTLIIKHHGMLWADIPSLQQLDRG